MISSKSNKKKTKRCKRTLAKLGSTGKELRLQIHQTHKTRKLALISNHKYYWQTLRENLIRENTVNLKTAMKLITTRQLRPTAYQFILPPAAALANEKKKIKRRTNSENTQTAKPRILKEQ